MTKRMLMTCAVAVLAAMDAPVLPAQSSVAPGLPLPLQPGETIKAKVGPDTPDVYVLHLAAGDRADLRIDQTAGDLRGRIVAPGGAASAFNNNESELGTEHVIVAADRAGEHRIELRSHASPARPYVLTLVNVERATPQDLQRVTVQALLQQAREAGDRRLAVLTEAVRVARDVGDARFLLAALMEHGRLEAFRDRRLARALFDEALELARTLNEPLTQESIFNDLGVLNGWLGEPRRSIVMMEQAFALAGARDPALRVPLLFHNISGAYRDLGDADRALRYAREALAAWREEGSPGAQAYALRNIAGTYLRLGDTSRALENVREALRLFRSEAYDLGIGSCLDTLSAIHVLQREFDKAIAAQKEARIHWRRAKDVAGEGRTHHGIGMALAAQGDTAGALVEYDQALALARKAGVRPQEAATLAAIGEARESGGERAAAATAFGEALALYRSMEDGTGAASALFGFARLARDGGRLDEARARIEEAMSLLEAQRTGVSSTDLRALFLASKRRYYEFYVDLLMRLHERSPQAGHLTAALAASERGRARALLDVLAQGGAGIRAGVSPDLVEAERRAQERVTAKARLLTQVLSGRPDAEAEAAARRELSEASGSLEEARAVLRADSPSYAALTQPRPLDVPALQRDVLDRDTTLVEYALGDEGSFAWVVTPTSISAHRLPPRAEIEAAAREAHRLVAESHRRTAAAQARVALSRLSDQILRPLARRLGSRRLVIVPDGALHYVPFAALPDPRSSPAGSGRPLIVRSEVVILPSASVAAALRKVTQARRPASKSVAVLADPVLGAEDPRVSEPRPAIVAGTDRPPSVPDDLLRSASDSGVVRFERLPSTADEADAIARAVGGGGVLRAVDFDASRGTATSGILGDYRIVHFATHALVNSRHPELSGLVLSLVGRDGTPEDGFLRLHDIYNLRLSADLVVLSACRTGLGREIAGEGLMGLTRGFMYAGAPRVVATLWDVRDRTTSTLMAHFYGAMFAKRQSPAAALRAAQLTLLADPARAAPFYWAGFTLQGDWK
jgi:CHAT domain-containing protein